jgi:hypothetical protein
MDAFHDATIVSQAIEWPGHYSFISIGQQDWVINQPWIWQLRINNKTACTAANQWLPSGAEIPAWFAASLCYFNHTVSVSTA